MAKKTTTKKAAKKAPAKKVAAKKAPVKKAPAKKVAAKKAPVKKVAAKKAPAKKAPAKKKATTSKTTVIARVDVGFGNSLYIRGEGAGLSWDTGVLLENVTPYEWSFTTTKATGDVTFKFLINDETWSESDDLVVAKGGTSISSPVFAW